MIELNSLQRKQLKEIQLELLDEFASFCKKNNLTFYLFGGTLLGAVRHKGFIPWDDDIDVCMPRKDYDLFCKLYKMNDRYFLQNASTDKSYFYHFSKLLKNDTIYNEYATYKLKNNKGIFIDIFPINGYPDLKNKLYFYNYNFWLFILNKKSYPMSFLKIRKAHRNFSYCLMTVIAWALLWWCPYHLCAKMRNRFLRLHQFESSSNNCIVGTNLRKVYEKKYFVGYSEVEFEGRTMPAMEDVTKYLAKMYGDYMQLPDEKERIPHHYLTEFKG